MYQPWSTTSLEETAAQFIKHTPCKSESNQFTHTHSLLQALWQSKSAEICFLFSYLVQQEGLTVSLSVAMAGIHQSATQYASVLLPAHPFSPQTYMEFTACFAYLCNHMYEHRQSQASR